MLIKAFLSDQRIIDCLRIHYGIEVTKLILLPWGADNNSSVYKAEVHKQLSYFIKLKRGHHHDIGIAVVELLHNAGMQQSILPINTIDHQSMQRVDDFTLIVYPYIEGQNGFSRALTKEQWITLGKMLRQVHEINVPLSLQHRIRREAYSSKWRDIVRSFYSYIESEAIGDEIALKFLAFFKEHILAIRHLVDRSEQLAQILQNETLKLVLCHSDIHGGNVLMDSDNAIFIIDWDDPIMAPKERDLMFIGGGVANVWNKPSEEAFFYKGYGETDVNKIILAYYRHERIVEDIALYGQSLLTTKDGDRAEMFKQLVAMFEVNGVVDIAFKTEKGFSHL